MIANSAIQSLNGESPSPHPAGEQRKGVPFVFIVAADDSQQMEGEKLAQGLRENEISLQGVDVLTSAKEAQLTAPEALKIRFSKAVS